MEFLDQVEQIIAQRFPSLKLERGEADFTLRINGHVTSLENLYRMSTGEPADAEYRPQLANLVDRWIMDLLRAAHAAADEFASFDELRDRILPLVLANVPQTPGGMLIVSQQVLEGLVVAYVMDSERTMSYVSQRLVEKWRIPMEELHETALQNLMLRSETLPAHAAQDESGRVNLILIQQMDGYDASRILLPGLYEHLKEHLGGPFVAGVPNRDILICFRDDPETVQRLRQQIAADYIAMPHQVTDRLFLVTADGIAPYSEEPAE
jgi:uncharacterized protein YtpQ (UPF0354 family)